MPTPCSPVIEPPTEMQYSRISSPAALAFSRSPGLRAIEQNDGMQVAVAGVKNVADGQSRTCWPTPAMNAQRGRDLGARHHAILHVVERADAAHRAEGVLAALPQQFALLGGFGRRDFTGAAGWQASRICATCSSTVSRSPSSSISSTAAASMGKPAWVASSTMRSITPSSISTATGMMPAR